MEENHAAKKDQICQMCQRKDCYVEFICSTCTKKLICSKCADLHKVVPVLQTHDVMLMEGKEDEDERCEQHDQAMEYYCSQCQQIMCVVCICDSKHALHSDLIMDFKSGLEDMQKCVNVTEELINVYEHRIDLCDDILKEEIVKLSEAKKNISSKHVKLQMMLIKIRKQQKDLDEVEAAMLDLAKAVDEQKQSSSKLRTESKVLCEVSGLEYIVKAKEWCEMSEEVMEKTYLILNHTMKTARYTGNNREIYEDVDKLEVCEEKIKDRIREKLNYEKSDTQRMSSNGERNDIQQAKQDEQVNKENQKVEPNENTSPRVKYAGLLPEQVTQNIRYSNIKIEHSYTKVEQGSITDGKMQEQVNAERPETINQPTKAQTDNSYEEVREGPVVDEHLPDRTKSEGTNYKERMPAENIQNSKYYVNKEDTFMYAEVGKRSYINKHFQEDVTEEQTKSEPELQGKRLVSVIKPGGEVVIEDPWEVLSFNDGTVLLVDTSLSYIQRLDTKGGVTEIYQLYGGYNVRSACVFNKHLLVASSDNCITKMALYDIGGRAVYKPEQVVISHISAESAHIVFISDYTHPGKILEYNMKTNETTNRVCGIRAPGKIMVAESDISYKYIVSCEQSSMLTRKVVIFNHNWLVLKQIESMQWPRGITLTPQGTILIADRDNNSVTEHSIEGAYLTELIHSGDVCHPVRPFDISYSPPYVWVLERYNRRIKVVRIHEKLLSK